MHIAQVISGGQTGADRAGLDAARAFGIKTGGWAPKDLKAEDGTIPEWYGLQAIEVDDEAESRKRRTERNVLESDATLIVTFSTVSSPGTALTESYAQAQPGKHVLVCMLDRAFTANEVAEWLRKAPGTSLNVAGPRESEAGVYWPTLRLLHDAFRLLQASGHLTPRSVPSNEAVESDIAVARQLRLEFIDLFKHWDIIRWQLPSWILASGGVIGAILASNNSSGAGSGGSWDEVLSEPLGRGIIAALMAFAMVSVVLQVNLIRYHITEEAKLHARTSALRLTSAQRAALGDPLPFGFASTRFWSTASAWLLVCTNLLVVGFGCCLAMSMNPPAAWAPAAPCLFIAIWTTVRLRRPIRDAKAAAKAR